VVAAHLRIACALLDSHCRLHRLGRARHRTQRQPEQHERHLPTSDRPEVWPSARGEYRDENQERVEPADQRHETLPALPATNP
jgi:hypothetical protein